MKKPLRSDQHICVDDQNKNEKKMLFCPIFTVEPACAKRS